MFWPFAFKAMAERLNTLCPNLDGSTPESKLYNVKDSDIPVKSFHTLFCPVYVLDSRLHSAAGPGPPKWEPRSRIGVYLGHSPFHAGSVALVFNPFLQEESAPSITLCYSMTSFLPSSIWSKVPCPQIGQTW